MTSNSTVEQLTSLFDRVARIAAAAARAQVAFVTLRRGRALCVVGTYGIYLRKFDESWDMGRQLVRRQTISYVANVQRDPNLKDHPLLKAAPFAKTLVHVPVQGRYEEIEAAITIINPELRWPFSGASCAMLTDLAMLVGDALQAVDEVPDCRTIQEVRSHLQEAAAQPLQAERHDSSGAFLLSTLAKRTSIRNRKDVSYVTLRTWAKPIKEYQLNALKIIKSRPDPMFIDEVATEMAAHVKRLFGVPRVGCLVPVPCGHSASTECLSVLITRSLSAKLNVPYFDALAHEPRKGSSHPRKNPALARPKLVSDAAHESVLLIDDVATSGRHIELAVQSLRSRAQHVTAIAWIGAG